MKYLMQLVAAEVAAIILLRYILLYLFQIDIFDYKSQRGQIVGIVGFVVVLGTIYSEVTSGGARRLGAEIVYDKGDARRYAY